jgi:hypothetical protein
MLDHICVLDLVEPIAHPLRQPLGHALDGVLRVCSYLEWEVGIWAVLESSYYRLPISAELSERVQASLPVILPCCWSADPPVPSR